MKTTIMEQQEEKKQERIDMVLGVSGIVIALSLIILIGGA